MKPVAVVCSDIHLSERAPRARQGEDWMEAQRKALDFVSREAADRAVPLLVAGDVFDRPRVSPEVEALALEYLSAPHVWIIPGQHDLPSHRYDLRGRSSYGVLEKAQTLVAPRGDLRDLRLGLQPWEVEEPQVVGDGPVSVLLLHRMVWRGEPPYPGAPESGNVSALVKEPGVQGWDFVVVGDNHRPFVHWPKKGPAVVNCGSLMRRTADQEDHRPACYVLYEDKKVETVYLPIEGEVFTREHIEKKKEKDERILSFVESLEGEVDLDLSFEENVDRWIQKNKPRENVERLLRETIHS